MLHCLNVIMSAAVSSAFTQYIKTVSLFPNEFYQFLANTTFHVTHHIITCYVTDLDTSSYFLRTLTPKFWISGEMGY